MARKPFTCVHIGESDAGYVLTLQSDDCEEHAVSVRFTADGELELDGTPVSLAAGAFVLTDVETQIDVAGRLLRDRYDALQMRGVSL